MRRRLVALIAGRGGVEIAPRFHLDEGDQAASPRDEIDFAARDGIAARQHRIAFETQHQDGDRFRPEPEDMRPPPPLRPIKGLGRSHRRSPASARASA